MNTTNLISTPAITGNIGSCLSQTATMKISGDFWGYESKDYLTNSCTGQVTEGSFQWNPGFGWWGIIIIIPFATLIGIAYFMDNF